MICTVLRDNRPCRELVPGGVDAREKAPLARHLAKRLWRPGADEEPVREMRARLNEADACTAAKGEQASAPAQKGNPKGVHCKGLQGALGWRVCQSRKKFYSVVTDRVAGGPSQVRPKAKSKHKRWPRSETGWTPAAMFLSCRGFVVFCLRPDGGRSLRCEECWWPGMAAF